MMSTANDRREELAIWRNTIPHITLHVMQYIIRSSTKILRDRLGKLFCVKLDF